MKKLLLLVIPFLLCGCSTGASKEDIASSLDSYIDKEEKDMKLLIDEKELEVKWEDNASIEAIKKLSPLSIQMHRYGGFEQVGAIGQSIASDDKRITTEPGDIVLYSSNQIVVFYGTNTWAYTKLGHINLSQNELNDLLDKENVALTIK